MNVGALFGGSNTNTGGETTISPVIPGVPDTPLTMGWDIILFMGLLSVLYAIYLKRKTSRVEA